MSLDDIADKLVDWAVNDDRIRALWIEAPAVRDLRRPYKTLEAHVAADEPVFPSLVEDVLRGIKSIPGLKVLSAADTPRFAKEVRMELGNQAFVLIAEQSFLLAKRPRAAVVPLVDKTGHLPHVLDYSKRS